MKTRNRSGLVTALAVSLGFVAALLAGGCADSDETTGAPGGLAEEAALGEDGAAVEIEHAEALGQANICRCPICTSRQAGGGIHLRAGRAGSVGGGES
jgi:hypothetical protein